MCGCLTIWLFTRLYYLVALISMGKAHSTFYTHAHTLLAFVNVCVCVRDFVKMYLCIYNIETSTLGYKL